MNISTAKRRIDLSVGAFAPTLEDQMQDQNLSLDEHSLHHFELDRKAIGRLSVRGVLSEAETDRAAMRLLKKISQKVKSANPHSLPVTPSKATDSPAGVTPSPSLPGTQSQTGAP